MVYGGGDLWLNGFLFAIALVLAIYYIFRSARNTVDYREDVVKELREIKHELREMSLRQLQTQLSNSLPKDLKKRGK